MKKLIFSAAVLASAFFAASCQQEEFAPAAEGNVVTFEVSIPEVVATKAGEGYQADGSNVNDLVYAVYSTTAETLEDAQKGQLKFFYAVNETSGQSFNDEGKSVVSLELLNDQNYLILFWAQSNDAWVKTTGSNINLLNVTYPTSMSANNEHLEAFSGVSFIKNVKGARKETVTLTRPFAQINLATTMPQAFKATLSQSEMTIVGAPLSFNVATKTPGTTYSTVDQPLTFAPADVPAAAFKADYTYAGANYIFAGKDNANIATVDVSYKIYTSHGTVNNTIPYVPVQQNYRTNILGNLLTSQAEYTVELEKKWADVELAPDPIYLAAAIGGEVTLDEDIVLTKPLEVVASMTINLNGKTISGSYHKNDGAIIKNSGTLTITGGTISSLGNNGGSAVQNNGTMTIEDVTLNGAPNADGSWPSYTVNNTGELTIINSTITSYHGAVASYGAEAIVTLNKSEIYMAGIQGFTSHGIYTYNGGKVVVNGGTYANKATDQASTGASVINGAVEVNAGNFSGRIENYYGTPVLKGGSYSVNPNQTFIAAGYKAMEKDGKFYVVPANADAVATSTDELKEALGSGTISSIYVKSGEYTFPTSVAANITIECEEGTVFNGNTKLNINGSTVIGATFSNPSGTAVDQTINGIFKNCTFTGSNGVRWGYAGETCVFEDCVFSGDVYGFHTDGGAYPITFTRCEFSGFNAFAGATPMITFNDCVFKSNGKSGYNGANLWGSAKFINTEFVFDGSAATEWIDCIGVDKTYEFTGCTVNGGSMFNTDKIFSRNTGTKITIDGVEYTWAEEDYFASQDQAVVTSTTALTAALESEAKTITVAAGEYTFPASSVKAETTIICEEGTVFTGKSSLNINGATVVGATFKNEDGTAVAGTINGTLKNCTFIGSEALRWCYTEDGKPVVFEDCVIKTDFRGFHFDGMEGDVLFKNCEINGFNAFGGEGTATFENCVFGNDESTYNGLNTYSNTVLTDCQFNFISGKTNFIDMEGTGKTLTITNCTATLDGVANPVTDFVGGSKIAVNTVILEGKTYVSYNVENPAEVRYEGDAFATGYMENALYFNNYIFEGEATIKVVNKTYGAIILENCKADINGDLITIDNDNNSVMILENLDLTLAEGKKLIKSTKTIYQVFMANITINGVKMTNENIGQYLENVGWFQVVEEI